MFGKYFGFCAAVLAICGGAFVCRGEVALDGKRIAADEMRGIKFGADKRVLIKYKRALPDTAYTDRKSVV